MNYKIDELNKAKAQLKNSEIKTKEINWIQRGPANVGGRTRAIIVDPDDTTNKTWYAGAATGGIWKTTDGGNSWEDLTKDFTNLSVNALAMSESNTNVIYAGTGESFPGGTFLKGNGIWKTTDKGISWTQLATTATNEDFAYVNRIIIDPSNEDIVLAATEKGILKTTDGGNSWNKVYSSNTGVEDLIKDPTDFNVLFAGENSYGIIRSTDAGETWTNSSNGIGAGKRFEVAISNVDHNYVFTSVEVADTVTNVYISEDNGINWKKFNDTQNFLGGQGMYDNAITAHPYNFDEVFVAGVDIWKLKFNGSETESSPDVLQAYTENTNFLSFINYGGPFLDGGMSYDEGTNLISTDWSSIEIRFGPGISQKAHRFTVPPNSTSGVDASNYSYQDYIDVPFQVWDTDNNRQLMVSFRDQEADGEFNLYERTSDAYGELGREYIFINAVEYDSNTPNENITQNGGHLYKNLYMFWPTLTEGATWDPDNLPESKVIVKYGTQTLISGEKTCIADAYWNYGGANSYNQNVGYGTTSIPGVHPDHHNLTIIPTDDSNFILIEGNDGGLAYSGNNGVTINQIPNNYITTQFYGVAKHPTKNEYIGGMQDNGTWQSPSGEDASSSSRYLFRIGGDGFEALWNTENPNLMLGSLYNNNIKYSTDGGSSWSSPSGITYNDGPFITRLSVSKEDPNLVFAVRAGGIYRSINFGKNWSKEDIEDNWVIDNTISSSHNIEVSLANGKYVWAGGGMASEYGLQMQLSSDYGKTFTALPNYNKVSMDAYCSAIATHPYDEKTAYVLFSLKGKPKVLRTKNLGQTWEDISGFETNSVSSNGFPDVVVNCLLVMPHDANIIWVGTDIGLFESTDNGESWHIANNGLPNVSVYDMHISGHQVVVATHGRGIWTVDIPEIDNSTYITSLEAMDDGSLKITSDLKVDYDSIEVFINNKKVSSVLSPSTGSYDFITDNTEKEDKISAYIIGYISDTSYKSNTLYREFELVNPNLGDEPFIVFPSPTTGILNIAYDDINISSIGIYD
ncbi:MAG: hypothetical protein GXO49_07740, partial [Chlorobi bacterium]|nr:hypothetical protein [Chlorobiota bacterium]